MLLVNLGTPDAPTPTAVRRYLAEFLSDPRVVEIPRGALAADPARRRPAHAAGAVGGEVRDDLDAPTARRSLVHSQKQRTLLLGYLGQRLKKPGCRPTSAPVELGMRYGNPSIADALAKLRAAGCERILVLPLYPQYAASTTASDVRRRRRASRSACGGMPGAALRRQLPRRPGLHPRARAATSTTTG